MKGLMMDTPLMIGSIMDHAERNFPNQEIVSVVADQPDFRYTFKDAFQRTRALGNALKSLGIDIGDRVGTLAWNDHRHFELIMQYPLPVRFAIRLTPVCFQSN
ncbi:MAG: hypothetical protein Ct9H90mP13_08230 [Pseudomonadota bacterium]|nr:MAG: hypothetical protein Ct9H90mP13_08230 [Pseudomonadota bacterium]